jgi:1-acyl-sn-glycerol-3-phosphate acyltransferase
MKSIRSIVRILSLIIHTGFTYFIYIIGLIPVKILRLRYEKWRNLYMHTWAYGVAKIFNLHIEVKGVPPEPPFFIVSNHLSYLDIIPLYLNLKCTFVAKKEVRSWPVLGPMVKSVGVIFVDRNRRKDVTRVNELVSNVLNKDQGLILFPEGTSSAGSTVLPFHSSLLKLPAASGLPVHTVSLYYETAEGDSPAQESVCFYGARESFVDHVLKLSKTTKVTCRMRFGATPVKSDDRKVLALKLREEVIKIFEPTS